mmetsp:Transcript_35681/g.90202  ORF Transcript_35681/g.90202 Transcript_35681/m.90202 type:complete len:761 (-) Transcript_35681:796-3078(-)
MANPGLQYAATLRQSLIQDLFQGDEHVLEGQEVEPSVTVEDIVGQDEFSLQDVDKDLEAFQDHELFRGIMEHGRVLKEYAQDVDDKLRQTELDSLQDYIAESDSMVALHDQIKSCDAILAGMEGLLGKFQSDLGKVSEEIRQLQVQSQMMSTKLKNRRAAEQKLGTFIENLSVSETMVNSILEAEVNEDYLMYLMELDKKLKYAHEDEVAAGSQAKRDLEPALEKLRVKALVKVRDFVLQKVYMLKRPKTNVQIIQQSSLLKNRYFVSFLRKHGQEIYLEIRAEYVAIMSKIYATHFRTYLGAMEKMQAALATQADTLGGGDSGAGGAAANVLSLFKKDAGARPTTEAVFELGERGAVLDQLGREAIIPHMAEYEGKKFPYEIIFRNVHKLLVDTASSEYTFVMDFFGDELVFKELFAPIVQVVEGDLAAALQDNWDLISVMLMMRINHEHRKLVGKQYVPGLDEYLDRVHMLLWPRFKMIFDNQSSSLRSGMERTLFNDSVQPHPVVRRYAALASSMLVLMSGFEADASGSFKPAAYQDMMSRLWAVLCDLLLRMSNLFRDRRMGIIFLITNYSHIRAALQRADAVLTQGAGAGAGGSAPGGAPAPAEGGNVVAPQALRDCEEALGKCSELYVEDQLMNHFPMLVEFVKKAEQQQKRMAVPEGQPIPNFAPPQAAPILRDFAARWQHSVESMYAEVGAHFASAACGKDVLQASMTTLLKYYTRMLELLKRQGGEGQAVVKDAVNIPAIMYEIKRITKTG